MIEGRIDLIVRKRRAERPRGTAAARRGHDATKITATDLVGRHDLIVGQRGNARIRDLHAAEEEEPVLHERATERAARLRPLQSIITSQPAVFRALEVADRVERVVTPEHEAAPVEAVGAGSRDRVHRRASRLAIAGGADAALHAELLKRVGKRHRIPRVVLGIVIRSAVDQILCAVSGAASYRDGDTIRILSVVRQPRDLDCAARQNNELVGVPAVERQADDLLLLDHPADADVARLHQVGVRRHAHRFRQRADLERDVQRPRIPHREHDACLFETAEPVHFGGELVGTHRKAGEDEPAPLVRDHEPGHPGVGLSDCHLSAGQRGAGFIHERARQLGNGHCLAMHAGRE